MQSHKLEGSIGIESVLFGKRRALTNAYCGQISVNPINTSGITGIYDWIPCEAEDGLRSDVESTFSREYIIEVMRFNRFLDFTPFSLLFLAFTSIQDPSLSILPEPFIPKPRWELGTLVSTR